MSDTAVLAIWNDVAEAHRPEFDEWYVREHVPERVGVPGFRAGRRYRLCEGARGPRDFTWYETDSLAVLTSPAYLARLDDPTPWTRRTMPWFVGMSRSACRVLARAGRGHGGVAGTVQLNVEPPLAEAFAEWAAGSLVPELAECPGVVAAQVWRADPEATRVRSAERELRPGEDAMVDHVLLVEATGEAALEPLRELLSGAALGPRGAREASPLRPYRLVFALERAEP